MGKILSALLKAITNFADQYVPVTEFRNFPTNSEERVIYNQHGFVFEPHLNLLKDITTAENAWTSLSKCRRRQIRRSFDKGTKLEIADNPRQVIQFYRILHELYSKKVKKKIPPLRTFMSFLDRRNNPGDGVILVVSVDDSVIGGIVCLIEPGHALTEWYVCGLDHTWHDHYPSVMATWAGIRFACDLGLPCFNFLGMGKPGVSYGVRDFKLRFGGELVDYGRFLRTGAMRLTQTNHNPQMTR
jgi:lipid II:glycine glycyltransferase (peptidoglycan interpeptide bridge formation enzyme)